MESNNLTGYRMKLAFLAGFACAGLMLSSPAPARAQARTNVDVLVLDTESGKPLNQARLTLEFQYREPGTLKRTRQMAFSAKTNKEGKYRFVNIPKGVTVRLVVTAERHQTFSKDYDIDRDDLLLEVKLRKPQPLV
jgi:hypothetical protein